MADTTQADSHIKDKVTSVREVVSGKSNNEIILVLQYYDYNVEKTIQAFVDDGAKEALTEWQFSGNKPVKKKKNKKKTNPAAQTDTNTNAAPGSGKLPSPGVENGISTSYTGLVNGVLASPMLNGGLVNGIEPSVISNGPTHLTYQSTPSDNLYNGSTPITTPTTVSLASPAKIEPADEIPLPGQVEEKPAVDNDQSAAPMPQRQKHRHHSGHGQGHGHNHDRHGHHEGRERTISTTSNASTDGAGKKHHAHMGLEKSGKDLQRQTISLERLRLLFNEEVDRSYKRIKTVFDEIRLCLAQREDQMMSEMNTVRDTGRDTFILRQGMAADLKVKIDRAERMNEAELTDLRAEIKHFVSERKTDEDIARTTRFMYDDDNLKMHIREFGEVIPVKCTYQWKAEPAFVKDWSESQHRLVTPPAPVKIQQTKTSVENSHTNKSSLPHLDASQAHEVAELQKRLKQNLNLTGIPVETYQERAQSAPAPPSNVDPAPRPDGSRRNRNRRRNDRPRSERPQTDRPREDNRAGFTQTPNGERVILIGRKTTQGGGSRPPRGRGRGGGGAGGGGNRGERGGRGGNPDSPSKGGNPEIGENRTTINSNNNSTSVKDNNSNVSRSGGGGGGPRSPQGQGGNRRAGSSGGSPRKPGPGGQGREGSGSPRRGGGRGGGGPRGGNRGSGSQGNNPSATTPAEKKEG
ncbi:spermatogenesis-associated serine-rich protein 2-like isoform X2 [Mya arenaria]|nr:spermatogenesis-associated serine-rich protein 2-like isoform X2 [Mya arenaria]XP_052812709.1 spermatogenesis-associated serine-rich protein 2-like isoform X2 [Mya arenaria]XP_052812710.1 spermatogenesis-associated serine-rich protein 2-like isoform X2 [Mya arenaria]XP_052812711.1 spermatogenesis-associated serine-rich protein 2-like isoform X2 [Mya arenaria]